MKREERRDAKVRSARSGSTLLGLIAICGMWICGCTVQPNAEDASVDQVGGGQLIQEVDTLHTSAGQVRVVLTATDTLYIVTDVDTLYRWTGSTNGFAVEDINGDGNEDVLINHISNVGGLNDLIIFLPKEKRFAQVKDFTDFPNATAVPGAPYYYSYRRAGCADGDWISDLFEIRADSTMWHGHLFGHGCDEGPPPSITMFLVDPSLPEEQWQRINSLPMDSAWTGAGDKWDFIAQYWAENYRRYLPRAK